MRIIFVFLIMLSAISCKDENKYPKEDSNCNACGVSDPHDAYDCQGNLIPMTEQMHMELREKRNKWICIYGFAKEDWK